MSVRVRAQLFRGQDGSFAAAPSFAAVKDALETELDLRELRQSEDPQQLSLGPLPLMQLEGTAAEETWKHIKSASSVFVPIDGGFLELPLKLQEVDKDNEGKAVTLRLLDPSADPEAVFKCVAPRLHQKGLHLASVRSPPGAFDLSFSASAPNNSPLALLKAAQELCSQQLFLRGKPLSFAIASSPKKEETVLLGGMSGGSDDLLFGSSSAFFAPPGLLPTAAGSAARTVSATTSASASSSVSGIISPLSAVSLLSAGNPQQVGRAPVGGSPLSSFVLPGNNKPPHPPQETSSSSLLLPRIPEDAPLSSSLLPPNAANAAPVGSSLSGGYGALGLGGLLTGTGMVMGDMGTTNSSTTSYADAYSHLSGSLLPSTVYSTFAPSSLGLHPSAALFPKADHGAVSSSSPPSAFALASQPTSSSSGSDERIASLQREVANLHAWLGLGLKQQQQQRQPQQQPQQQHLSAVSKTSKKKSSRGHKLGVEAGGGVVAGSPLMGLAATGHALPLHSMPPSTRSSRSGRSSRSSSSSFSSSSSSASSSASSAAPNSADTNGKAFSFGLTSPAASATGASVAGGGTAPLGRPPRSPPDASKAKAAKSECANGAFCPGVLSPASNRCDAYHPPAPDRAKDARYLKAKEVFDEWKESAAAFVASLAHNGTEEGLPLTSGGAGGNHNKNSAAATALALVKPRACPLSFNCPHWKDGTCNSYHPADDPQHQHSRREWEEHHGPVIPRGFGCLIYPYYLPPAKLSAVLGQPVSGYGSHHHRYHNNSNNGESGNGASVTLATASASSGRLCDRGVFCPYWLRGQCSSGHNEDDLHSAARLIYEAWRRTSPANIAACFDRSNCEGFKSGTCPKFHPPLGHVRSEAKSLSAAGELHLLGNLPLKRILDLDEDVCKAKRARLAYESKTGVVVVPHGKGCLPPSDEALASVLAFADWTRDGPRFPFGVATAGAAHGAGGSGDGEADGHRPEGIAFRDRGRTVSVTSIAATDASYGSGGSSSSSSSSSGVGSTAADGSSLIGVRGRGVASASSAAPSVAGSGIGTTIPSAATSTLKQLPCWRGPYCPYWVPGKGECKNYHPGDDRDIFAQRLYAEWLKKGEGRAVPCYKRFDCAQWKDGTCNRWHPPGDPQHEQARREYERAIGKKIFPVGKGCKNAPSAVPGMLKPHSMSALLPLPASVNPAAVLVSSSSSLGSAAGAAAASLASSASKAAKQGVSASGAGGGSVSGGSSVDGSFSGRGSRGHRNGHGNGNVHRKNRASVAGSEETAVGR